MRTLNNSLAQDDVPASESASSSKNTLPNAVDILTGLIEIGPACSPEFLHSLRNAVNKYPSANWSDSLSRGQIRSKRWLVKELKGVLLKISKEEDIGSQPTHLGSVYLCAGWYAILAEMIFHEFGDKITRIRSFDIDPKAVAVAKTLIKHRSKNREVISTVMDIHKLKFTQDRQALARFFDKVRRNEYPDTIVNTSCEHLTGFDGWWLKVPRGKLVVVQSNNYFDHVEHVNCVSSLSEFAEQTPMDKVWFEGSLELPIYTRYMRIGVK